MEVLGLPLPAQAPLRSDLDGGQDVWKQGQLHTQRAAWLLLLRLNSAGAHPALLAGLQLWFPCLSLGFGVCPVQQPLHRAPSDPDEVTFTVG